MSDFTSDVVIGLEIHVELNTKTKIFCGCPARSVDGEQPNSRTCPTCLGMPGSKPVLNRKVVEYGIRLALALRCDIAPQLIFSRKSYFYPDLAKNYQISQFELPLGSNGWLELNDETKIGITRAHLEEDPASLVHQGSMHSSPFVLIDYNRSGDPLCEIVTEPDMTSAEQAREFMKKLINILNYVDVFDIQDCIIKADVNVSIKESGYMRSEVKNVTGFKDVERVIQHEVERQKKAVKDGETLIMDTRSWDSSTGTTTRIRTKETESDYGYITDPDLVPIIMTPEHVDAIKSALPEMPHTKAMRFMKEFDIPSIDAHILTSEKTLAHLFEKTAKKYGAPFAVRWMRHEMNRCLNLIGKIFGEVDSSEDHFFELFTLVHEKKINDPTAKSLLERLVKEDFSPKAIVEEEGLGAVSNDGELRKLCEQAIAESDAAVADVKSGNMKAMNSIVGKVMKATGGKASPQDAANIIKELLGV